MAAFDDFIEAVYAHAGLSEREQELVIHSVASATGARYVWHQHVWLSKDLGITDAEIEVISRGGRMEFTALERALIAYARGVATDQVSDRLHEWVAAYLSTDTLVGLSMVVCTYEATACLLAALDIKIEAGEEFGTTTRKCFLS